MLGQMTDEGCREGKKFRQRMERPEAELADVRRSPIGLLIDPRGEQRSERMADKL